MKLPSTFYEGRGLLRFSLKITEISYYRDGIYPQFDVIKIRKNIFFEHNIQIELLLHFQLFNLCLQGESQI